MGLGLVVYWGLIYIDGGAVEGYCEYRRITIVKQVEFPEEENQ